MTITDTWKKIKKKNEGCSLIIKFSNIMAKEMLEFAKTFAKPVQIDIDKATAKPTCDNISSLSQDKVLIFHTKIFLGPKHQLRCIWCSKVNLL